VTGSELGMQASALHIAAREGQFLALYNLITIHSVDVNIKDAWGWTPVDSAVREEQWPSAVLLMSWGGMYLQKKSNWDAVFDK
jgi:hypothetical protein